MEIKEKLKEWKGLCEKATPGDNIWRSIKWIIGNVCSTKENFSSCDNPNPQNITRFIAVSRTAMPILIEALEIAIEGTEEYKSDYEQYGDMKPQEILDKIAALFEK